LCIPAPTANAREGRPVVLDNGSLVLGGDRYSPADVIKFRNGSDEFLDWA